MCRGPGRASRENVGVPASSQFVALAVTHFLETSAKMSMPASTSPEMTLK